MRDVILLSLLTLICVPLLLIGFYLCVVDIYKAHKSRKWPSAKGQLIKAEIKKASNDGGLSYEATVKYIYSVDGVEFNSEKIGFLGLYSSSDKNAKKLVGHLNQNEAVAVFYNPIDPSESVLITGVNMWHTWSIVGSVFLLFFILATIRMWTII